mmetsp:Transcript_17364/g.47929  ORF Transcript_17364/g.47929 Transcript_17364/m.47929 type:complete len:80 (+) Transcript_17364:246-485(+)
MSSAILYMHRTKQLFDKFDPIPSCTRYVNRRNTDSIAYFFCAPNQIPKNRRRIEEKCNVMRGPDGSTPNYELRTNAGSD